MDFNELVEIVQRRPQDINLLLKKHGIDNIQTHTQDHVDILLWEFRKKKPEFIQEITKIIQENPFIHERQITELMCRPSSYTKWLLVELTDMNPDLAETDDDLLFFISDLSDDMRKKLEDES